MTVQLIYKYLPYPMDEKMLCSIIDLNLDYFLVHTTKSRKYILYWSNLHCPQLKNVDLFFDISRATI